MGGAQAIHKWMFKQKAFWKHINMEGGEEYGEDSKLIEDVFARTGSYIMGKRMFEEGEVHWKKQDNQPKERISEYKVERILFNSFSMQDL